MKKNITWIFKMLLLGMLIVTYTKNGSAQTWKIIANDKQNDGKLSGLPDGKQFSYLYKQNVDSIYFRFELYKWGTDGVDKFGVNVVARVLNSPSSTTVTWWGEQNNKFDLNRLITVWVTKSGNSYSGTIGVADEDGINSSPTNYTNIAKDNIKIQADFGKKLITIGLKRSDFILDNEISDDTATVVIAGAVGSDQVWNDDLFVKNRFIRINKGPNKPPIINTFNFYIIKNFERNFNKNIFLNDGKYNDFELDPLVRISVKSIPSHGTLEFDGTVLTGGTKSINAEDIGKLKYTPDKDFLGVDSFIWNAYDGKSFSVDKNVILLVRENKKPVLTNDLHIEDPINKGETVKFEWLYFNQYCEDPDPGQTDHLYAIKIKSLPKYGKLEVNGNAVNVNDILDSTKIGNLVYTAEQDTTMSLTESFDWQAFDGIDVSNTKKVFITIKAAVGIEEYFRSEVRLYPNPAHNFVVLDLNQNLKDAFISLKDISGRVVYQSFNPNLVSGMRIDFPDLTKGLYFLDIQSEKGKMIKKLIVE